MINLDSAECLGHDHRVFRRHIRGYRTTPKLGRVRDRVRDQMFLKGIEIFFRIFLVCQFSVHFFPVCKAFISSLETVCFSLLLLSFTKELEITELNTEPERSGSLHAYF